MSDISQLNLTEPGQTDWDNYAKSGWVAPPPAIGPDGEFIQYQGVAKAVELESEYPEANQDTKETFLTVKLDPILVKAPGTVYDGYEIKFTKAGRRPYTRLNADGTRTPKKGNPSRLGDYLRAAGSQGKPQTNSEYLATAKAAANKTFGFTIDWEARNKETGEQIKGYRAFPDDPAYPGQKKAILKQGDFYNEVDAKGVPTGQVKQVQSEVLFANARLRFFSNPAPKKG